MMIADSVAALIAIAAFVAVFFVVSSANARRSREAARREWQANLQARGAWLGGVNEQIAHAEAEAGR